MPQFDLYANPDRDTKKTYPYFVDVQNGLLDDLNSRVVIPLTPTKAAHSQYPNNLCPTIAINNKNYALLSHHISTVSTKLLQKKKKGSLTLHRDEIVAAIDFLITGI